MSTNNKRPEIKQHRITQQQQKKKKKKKKKKKTIKKKKKKKKKTDLANQCLKPLRLLSHTSKLLIRI
jgi:hypothetical protein